jgi:TPR repeat protein
MTMDCEQMMLADCAAGSMPSYFSRGTLNGARRIGKALPVTLMVLAMFSMPGLAGGYDAGLPASGLSASYEHGHGVRLDSAVASDWHRRAAEQGQLLAQIQSGAMQPSSRDETEAINAHRKAAEQGDLRGLLNLALAYSKGLGVAQDSVLAYVFATHNPKYRKIDLADRVKLAEEIKAQLTASQLTEAGDLIGAWQSSKQAPVASRTGGK